jgi:hypothetical protein
MNRRQLRGRWLTSHRHSGRYLAAPRTALAGPAGSISLHIDELVLHGFPSSSRHLIAEATQKHLINEIRKQPIPAQFKTTHEQAIIDGGSFRVPSNSPSTQIGALVARAIYGGHK